MFQLVLPMHGQKTLRHFSKHLCSTFFLISAGSTVAACTYFIHSTQTSRTSPLYLVRKHFSFLGMRCLFPLFQTQLHLLKPRPVYILRASINLVSDHTKGWPHTQTVPFPWSSQPQLMYQTTFLCQYNARLSWKVYLGGFLSVSREREIGQWDILYNMVMCRD